MSPGIERLKKLYQSKPKDPALTKLVNYLARQLDLAEMFCNETKNIDDMLDYLKRNAKDLAVNNMAMVDDETVFMWAKDYWTLSNEELGINVKSATTPKVKAKTDNTTPQNQLSLELTS